MSSIGEIEVTASSGYHQSNRGGHMTVEIGVVAAAITERAGEMTAMKLQKLCFYAQAWHAFFLEEPLVEQDFEAWINGPVSPALFDLHRGKYMVSAADFSEFSSATLGYESTQVVQQVLKTYGVFSGDDLSRLTHRELPWLNARGNSENRSPSREPISLNLMVRQCEAHMATYAGAADGSEAVK